MSIFSFNTPPEPADRKTPVSTDATASGPVPPPAAEMTPPRVEPPRAIPPTLPPATPPATTHDPVEPDPLKTLDLKPQLVEALSTVYDPEIPRRIIQRFDDRVFLIDTGMLAGVYQGQASALEFTGDGITAIHLEERLPLGTSLR